MATIKRTSPGPKFGGVGSNAGAPSSIGTKGKVGTTTSTAGGQYPFLPSPKSSASSASTKSGQTASPRTDNLFDFMPRKAGGKK